MDVRVDVGVDVSRLVARVEGDVSLMNVSELRSRLHSLLATGARTLVVDVSAARFGDASGPAVLVALARDAQDLGVELVVRRPGADTLRLLHDTGLERLLSVGDGDDADAQVAAMS